MLHISKGTIAVEKTQTLVVYLVKQLEGILPTLTATYLTEQRMKLPVTMIYNVQCSYANTPSNDN